MPKILEVKFRQAGKIYYFLPGKFNCRVNDFVIANSSKGVSFGKIVKIDYDKPEKLATENDLEIKEIIRLATKRDIVQHELNKKREEKAFSICMDKIKKNNLNMRIIDVECMFDRRKIVFYFSADGKVDFRNLVRDLAATLKARIELRQIGVRDQSKILGGLGICGQPFCCATFLNDFGTVSIKMAKEQGLSLNPIKLSGTCGRLMCCLQYEQNAYDDLIKCTPAIGTRVSTVDGNGEIVDVNLLTGFLKVMLEDEKKTIPQIYHKDDVKIIK